MTFAPTHRVPEPGVSTWASAEADEPDDQRLGAGLEVQVVRVEGKRARVVCSNSWETWVNADKLVTLSPGAPSPPAPTGGGGRENRRTLMIVAAVALVAVVAGVVLAMGGDDDGSGGGSSNPTTPFPTERLAAPATVATYQRAPSGNQESDTNFLVGYVDVAAQTVLSFRADRVGEDNVAVRMRSQQDVMGKERGPVSSLTVDGVTYLCSTGGTPTRGTMCAWARGHTLFVILGPPAGDRAMTALAAQAMAGTRGV